MTLLRESLGGEFYIMTHHYCQEILHLKSEDLVDEALEFLIHAWLPLLRTAPGLIHVEYFFEKHGGGRIIVFSGWRTKELEDAWVAQLRKREDIVNQLTRYFQSRHEKMELVSIAGFTTRCFYDFYFLSLDIAVHNFIANHHSMR